MIPGHDGVKYWRGIMLVVALLLGVAVLATLPTRGSAATSMTGNSGTGVVVPLGKDPGTAVNGPIISRSERNDTSPPLRSMRPILTRQPDRQEPDNENPILPGKLKGASVVDTVVKSITGPFAMPTPMLNFDGMYNVWGPLPPDTNGDVGPNHYVQNVNSGISIYTKAGALLWGPANTNTLWQGFGGPCETRNDGDGIVLYDPLADRWNISQFTSAAPYYQCIAVSATGDPLGAYHRYAFLDFQSSTALGDYPKLGVWPDAYYMTTNEFAPGFIGGGNYAFERSAMLAGTTAHSVFFLTPLDAGGLPSDIDGHTPPPAGSPNYFLFNTDEAGILDMYKFHVDWTNPISSTFGPAIPIAVAPWNGTICTASRGACIDQPNSPTKVEAIADRFMHRMAYRNMGDHESLVVNQTVNITTTVPGIAGIRWYELRAPNAITPTVYQQGTYTLNDSTHRWMGSAAMDRMGNIAIGFSASSTVISPSIRYAGRLATDPLGQLSQGESLLYQGQGVEVSSQFARWGDYSSISVDPSDDCTYWYTTEYYGNPGDRNWRTRIGTFKFPNCGQPDQCQISFSDVHTTDWFYDFVRCLYCKGAISGYADGTFRPFNNTTRGQMTKIVVAAFGIPINTTGGPHFTDVATNNPFYAFIETAYNNGIVSGYSDNTFRWGNDVTRGQLSKIVVQAAIIVNHWVLINPTTPTFSDVPTNDPFYVYIETAYCHGIISGYSDGTFRSGNNATRAQISKIVCLAVRNEITCNFAQPTFTPTAQPTLCPGGISTSGSITSSDPTMAGRLVRAGSASTCAQPRGCPGVDITTPAHYDSYVYTNTLTVAQCVTVRIRNACGNNFVQSIAYDQTFDPANLCTNYLGSQAVAGPIYSYSFTLPAGHAAVVVVEEGVANLGCSTYYIDISPCQAVPTYTPVPSNTPTITRTPSLTATSVAGTSTSTATRTSTPACSATPAWTAGPTLTPGRYAFQGGLLNDNKFYIAGGQLANNTPVADVKRFNGTTNAWEAVPSLPVAVGQVAVASSGTKLYVGGGYLGGTTGNSVTTTVQVYDMATNAWSFVAPLPSRVEAAAGVFLNNKFYVMGGDDFTVGLDTNYIYDVGAGTWSTGAPLPEARTNVYATTVGGFIYLFGGVTGDFTTARDNILRYDPVANSWTTLSSANTGGNGNYGGISPYGAGRLFVTDGGSANFVPTNGTHIYDIASNTWTVGPTTPNAHLGHAQVTLPDGRVLVASGFGTSTTTTEAVDLLVPGTCPGLQPIQIQNSAFSPQNVSITAGTIVRWTNFDPTSHSATSDTAIWDSGTLTQTGFYQRAFTTPGTFPYHCTFHTGMTGTITVTSAGPVQGTKP